MWASAMFGFQFPVIKKKKKKFAPTIMYMLITFNVVFCD